MKSIRSNTLDFRLFCHKKSVSAGVSTNRTHTYQVGTTTYWNRQNRSTRSLTQCTFERVFIRFVPVISGAYSTFGEDAWHRICSILRYMRTTRPDSRLTSLFLSMLLTTMLIGCGSRFECRFAARRCCRKFKRRGLHGHRDAGDHRFPGSDPKDSRRNKCNRVSEVTATSQSGSSQLVKGESTANAVSYLGAFNSAGTYTVSFSYDGQTSSSSTIVVGQAANGCGVNTVTLNATIQGNQIVIQP